MPRSITRDQSPDSQDFVLIDETDLNEFSALTPKEIQDIRKWLDPTDFLGESSEYNKHLTSYVAGTGKWIQETDAYQKWHDSPDHGSLWTKAIAGAGKSVFAAMIASKLQKENIPVLFFFFRQIIATNHHPQSLARDFISQILDHSPFLQVQMKKHMDAHRTLDNISTHEFWQDLLRGLALLPKVYCVVDALDEMDIDQEPFLHDLVQLGKRKPSSIKLLMTSRPLPRIEATLRDPSVLQVRLEQIKVDKDIAIYVDHRLSQHPDLKEDLCLAIKDAIGEKAKGSFLYSRLMMDELLIGHFPHMIPDIQYLKRSLDWLPITLEDMYNGMLLDHSLRSGVPQDLQLLILSWVTHSSRPLRLLELATILDSTNPSGPGKDTKSVVREACGPLLEILEDETVSVIHHSFTEFLTDISREGRPAADNLHPQFPIIAYQPTHHALAATCIKYLSGGALSSWNITPHTDGKRHYRNSKADKRTIKTNHPFLDYAINNWYVHVSKMPKLGQDICLKLDYFLTPESHECNAWLDLVWPQSKVRGLLPLHIAAWAKMESYASYLIGQGVPTNERDESKRTPLSWACAKGHVNIVALLLRHVEDPDLDDSVGWKPLHYAAQANHYKVVKLLLEAGVDVMTPKTREHPGRRCGNARRTTGETSWYYAVLSGNIETVKVMIPYVNVETLNKALCTAARAGKADVIDLLLTLPGITADQPESLGSPLFIASEQLNAQMMRSLLKAGADPKRRCWDENSQIGYSFHYRSRRGTAEEELCPTPLHALSGRSSERSNPVKSIDPENAKVCFELLLNAGCDLSVVDAEGNTPLHYSARANYEISRLLLAHGADPNAKNKTGNTPLHKVELSQHTYEANNAVLLLKNGADINVKRHDDGRSPIHTLVDTIQRLDLKFLLPYVSDWNIPDANGDTVLHIVLRKSFHPEDVVSTLLAAGANPNLKNKTGLVPLHTINEISNRNISMLKMLIEYGVDVEARDYDGRTTLLRALLGSHPPSPDTLASLLSLGANIHAVDYAGNGVLHTVCGRRGGTDMFTIQKLLDAGADPFRVNNAGNTLLHQTTIGYRSTNEEKVIEVLRALLKLGINPVAKNHVGQTALHYACSSIPNPAGGKEDILRMMLDSEMCASINIGDRNGIRPIHLAATISEQLVARLIERGADLTLTTDEGWTVFHIAARSRQSNIIGLLLDHFSTLENMEILKASDKEGRTALHIACRSGRPETVALLLNAGADATAKDMNKRTPLHTCSEFKAEQELWTGKAPEPVLGITNDAGGILINDILRPIRVSRNNWFQQQSSQPATENDTVRMPEIIHLLLREGADLYAKDSAGALPISRAALSNCSHVVQILSVLMNQNPPPSNKDGDTSDDSDDDEDTLSLLRPRYGFRETYFSLKPDIFEALKGSVLNGSSNYELCNELLSVMDYDAIKILPQFGVMFGPFTDNSRTANDFLTVLANFGFTDLLDSLGSTIENPSWIDGKSDPEGNDHNKGVQPYLLSAISSCLPNLDMVRLLVEKFKADINIQAPISAYKDKRYVVMPGPSALHQLANGRYWWYQQAIQYLLDLGADPELRDERGQTALHIAVSHNNTYASYPAMRRKITKLLLFHGASPNAINDAGMTCLGLAAHDIELVKMLIQAGADMTLGKQTIFYYAIEARDVATLKAVLETGVNCNIRPKVDESVTKSRFHHGIHDHELYPLHYAASSKFRTKKDKTVSIDMIKLLLDHGAYPYLTYRDGLVILHNIFESGGILEPFLDLPDLDPNARDGTGRTLLHAACLSGSGAYSLGDRVPVGILSSLKPIPDPTCAMKLYEKGADLTAVSFDGSNALHYLLLAHTHSNEEFKKTFSLFIEKEPSLVQQKNKAGFTPFHIATKNHRLWSAETLLAAGANPHDKDPEGNTPLHHLSRSQYESEGAFKKYLDLGIDINEPNDKGETAVFAFFCSPLSDDFDDSQETQTWRGRNTLKMLTDAGADFFMRNYDGESLLHVVAKKGRRGFIGGDKKMCASRDCFKMLMNMGLDPMLEDCAQRSALDVAAAFEHYAILELFKRDTKV